MEPIETSIEFLEAELSALDDDLGKAIRKTLVSREKNEFLQTVSGVSAKVSTTLVLRTVVSHR